ncbi:hypothetical protein IBG24_00325 [Aeromicrobium sp. zg-636]|uniref:Cyclic nucleotide-binding domain-containing protein n=1 Tax=Aeromicrobium senzhongii TaxID=2663859 RepID=A0A8I0JZI9_9ACTN|nr:MULTISPECIES: hypothetical protein [Aeromicrobium]MBC9224753.1 hypothetical protein [Aeromicrobium senzhongii]
MRSTVRAHVITGVSALVLAAGLGACSGEGSGDPEGYAEPTRLVADASTPFAQEGQDYTVSGKVLGRLGDRSAAFAGWTEDGTEIYQRFPGRFDISKRPGDSDPRQAALMARDPATGKTRVLSDRPRTARPAPPLVHDLGYSATTIDGNRVLWVETYDISLGDLYVHDLETGRETLLVSAKGAGKSNPPWPTGLVDPVVRGETVYFVGYTEATVNEVRGARGRTSVFAVPIDGSGEPTEIVPGATDLFAGPDGLLEVVLANRLVRWDPAKGPDGEVDESNLPGPELYANESGVRMSHSEDGKPILIESPKYGRFQITVGNAGSVYLTASDRWAAFSILLEGGTQAFLLDMARGELRRIKDVQFVWHGRPATPETYIARPQYEITPKTFDVLELVPAD